MTYVHMYTCVLPKPPRHVINDQDIVPRGGKLLSLYKRNGHRAIVNRAGASGRAQGATSPAAGLLA